ncbi:DsrE family protein [Marinobacterium arenosum]|uniref:DsrE family protein n=1 Tax=Marinobacterium arenosum TaxID=2862496 RepID=UPI001C9418CD|nr:hypothetical protein [Marinobacterium arenosum]MBY4678307.1 hypothetical protein [Marinobacterium arenosum]
MSLVRLMALVLALYGSAAPAQPLQSPIEPGGGYLAEIRVHSPMEIEAILQRASSLVEQARDYNDFEPIVFILHGSEAEVFRAANRQRYRKLIDLAAQLDAFRVIDVKVCESWMRVNNVQRSELPAFIETVPFGPSEERRLKRQGFRYF